MFHHKYGHGHSATLGFLLALALERHTLTLVLIAAAAGLVAGRAWSFWADTARAIKGRLLNAHAKRERIETRPLPVYDRIPPDDDIPF